MKAMDALGSFALLWLKLEMVGHMDPLDHEHVIVFFHFPNYVRPEVALSRRNLTRLQRASKGASQSATGGSNEIVKRGGMRLMDGSVYAIVLGDFRVNAKLYGCLFGGQIGAAKRAFDAFNTNLGSIGNRVGHEVLLEVD